MLSPAQIKEIVDSCEIVWGQVEQGAVKVTYVAPEWLYERYGAESVQEALRTCMRVGARVLDGRLNEGPTE